MSPGTPQSSTHSEGLCLLHQAAKDLGLHLGTASDVFSLKLSLNPHRQEGTPESPDPHLDDGAGCPNCPSHPTSRHAYPPWELALGSHG